MLDISFLTSIGIPHADLSYWRGVLNLDFSTAKLLFEYLKIASKDEVYKLNSLIKEKFKILKSGDRGALMCLLEREKKEILKKNRLK